MELSDIPFDQIAQYQQTVLMRLHLWVTGRTHQLLLELLDRLRSRLVSYARPDGTIDPLSGFGLSAVFTQEWRETFSQWQRIFEEARWQAAAIPFGSLARYHQHYMTLPGLEERLLVEQSGFPPAFTQQIQDILDAAGKRVYDDGFSLYGDGFGIPGPSARIWRLDSEGLAGLQQIVATGLANQDSAWNMAQELEVYLGPGQECPRWTSTRLFKLTKTQIAAGDLRGLHSGNPCGSAGVAYKALRLARNEIQIVHHAATDAIFRRSPWVEYEQINLSPAHPPINCACEDVVAGGKKGDGVYPVGTITLPIHVQCLCFKTAGLMPGDEFAQRMRGWLVGQQWPAMDSYAQGIGATRFNITDALLLAGLAAPLLMWLDGDEADIETAMIGEQLELELA